MQGDTDITVSEAHADETEELNKQVDISRDWQVHDDESTALHQD